MENVEVLVSELSILIKQKAEYLSLLSDIYYNCKHRVISKRDYLKLKALFDPEQT